MNDFLKNNYLNSSYTTDILCKNIEEKIYVKEVLKRGFWGHIHHYFWGIVSLKPKQKLYRNQNNLCSSPGYGVYVEKLA